MALSTGATVAIVLGGVAVVGGGAYLVLRRGTMGRAAPGTSRPGIGLGATAANIGPKLMAQTNQAGRAGGGTSLQGQLTSLGVGALNKYAPGLGDAAKNVAGLAGKLPGAGKAIGAAKSALKKIKFW
jgi:hypothetical protein